MLAGMTVQQLAEWRAYADLEPFDEVRADLRTASIVATLINLKSKRKVKPSDVVLQFGDTAPAVPKDPKTARQQVAGALNLVRAMQDAAGKRSKRKNARPRK